MNDSPVEALEGALRSIDASLSILVVARENLILRLQLLAAEPAPAPAPEPGRACTHPEEERLPAGNGGAICGSCGEET